jgi:flagellar motor switch protein FliM
MTMTDKPLISPEEVASVLSQDQDAAESPPPEPGEAISDVYSLRRPLAIAPEDEPHAKNRVEGFAQALVETIRRELETTIECQVRGFQQQQAGPAVDALPAPCWLLTFVHAERGGISLVMDPACAMSLVELALGGIGNSTAAGREPTDLETRVLTTRAGALSKPLARRARLELTEAVFTVAKIPKTLADRGEMVGAALLQLKFSGAERTGLLLVSSSLLREEAAVADDASRQGVGPLAARLEGLPVTFRPVLPAGTVTLGDLVALKPGAVLTLEAPESTPLDLRVDGLALFEGHVRRENGRAEFRAVWRRGRPPREESEEKS